MGTSLLASPSLTTRRAERAPSGLRQLLQRLATPWRAWHERRHAAACAREVLRLQRMLVNAQPWLNREERHRKLVASYLVCDPTDATALLRCAEASFATWPVPRELTLRDVAHYLAVSELLAASGEAGVHASLKRVIDATIPAGL